MKYNIMSMSKSVFYPFVMTSLCRQQLQLHRDFVPRAFSCKYPNQVSLYSYIILFKLMFIVLASDEILIYFNVLCSGFI